MCAFGLCSLNAQSYNGQKRALDFAENALGDLEDAGVEYNCHGDDTDASCRIRDIAFPLFSTTIANGRFEVSFKDNQYKQRIYAEFDVDSKHIGDKRYIPHSLECVSVYNINGIILDENEKCKIEANIATLHFDAKGYARSTKMRDRSALSIIKELVKLAHDDRENRQAILRKAERDTEKLNKETYDKLDALYAERDTLQEQYKEASGKEYDNSSYNRKSRSDMMSYSGGSSRFSNVKSNDKCGCEHADSKHHSQKQDSLSNLLNDRKHIEKELAKNERELKELRNARDDKLIEINEEYADSMQESIEDTIKKLKKYDFDIQEVRLELKTNYIAKNTFKLFAKDFFAFNENTKLSKKEARKRAEEKKRITAEYYASIEAMRAASITYINYNPHLSDNTKKNFVKIIDEHAKLFEPHTGKNRIKIIARHLDSKPYNAGEFAKVLWDYYNDNITQKEFIDKFFNVVNSYDIRAVRYFPL